MDDIFNYLDLPITRDIAKEKAKNTLRTQIGSLPHLGEPSREGDEWVFPLLIRYPRVVFDYVDKKPRKLGFLSEMRLGDIKVNGLTGEVKHPKASAIKGIIRSRLDNIEIVVQKALIRSEAKKFSHLPYSELRYSPIVDLLAMLLIKDKIDIEKDIGTLDVHELQKYSQYIDMLVRLGLVCHEGNIIRANDPLIELDRRDLDLTDKLAVALELFFEAGFSEIDTMREILGPYLMLSGYYYMRVIESGELKEIGFKQFEEHIQKNYSGKEGVRKKLQLSRYLIQLQEVKLLRNTRFNGDSYWQGFEEVHLNILNQEDILEPIGEIIA